MFSGIKVGGGKRIVITQAANSTKSIKIQPKPEPGISQALPVVTVPKINKGKVCGGEICVFNDQKCAVLHGNYQHFGTDSLSQNVGN